MALVVAGGLGLTLARSVLRQLGGEIKSMISASVETVDNGSRLANDAGTAMGEIVQQVKRVPTSLARSALLPWNKAPASVRSTPRSPRWTG